MAGRLNGEPGRAGVVVDFSEAAGVEGRGMFRGGWGATTGRIGPDLDTESSLFVSRSLLTIVKFDAVKPFESVNSDSEMDFLRPRVPLMRCLAWLIMVDATCEKVNPRSSSSGAKGVPTRDSRPRLFKCI